MEPGQPGLLCNELRLAWRRFERISSSVGAVSLAISIVVLMLPRSIPLHVAVGGAVGMFCAVLLLVAIAAFVVAGATAVARLALGGSVSLPLIGVHMAGLAMALASLRVLETAFVAFAATYLVAVIVLGNVAATREVHRARFLIPRRRSAQLGLIWLVPIVGAVIVRSWYSTDE